MATVKDLKNLVKTIKKFCVKEKIRGYNKGLEIFSAVVKQYAKADYPPENNVIEKPLSLKKRTIIKEITSWNQQIKIGAKKIEDIDRTFDAQKTALNNILFAMWFKGSNELNIGLAKGDDYIRFICNSFEQTEAEENFNSLPRNKGKAKKTPPSINQEKISNEKKADICRLYITVPHPTELFQGRKKDIGEIFELIKDNKIIAVTGPPGQGKTEIVLTVAHIMAEQKKFPQGIFWASDREDERDYPLKNLDSIFNAVLKSIGAPEVEKIPPGEKRKQVTEILNSGESLLVLDNFDTEAQIIQEKMGGNSGTNIHALGLTYLAQKKFNEAEKTFKEALNIYEKRKYIPCLVREWSKLALVYWRTKRPDQADQALKRSLSFANRFNNSIQHSFQTEILNDLGHICLELGQHNQVEAIIKKIMTITENLSRKMNQAKNWAKIGILYEGIGDINQTITYTQKAMKIFNRFGYVLKSRAAKETLDRLKERKKQ